MKIKTLFSTSGIIASFVTLAIATMLWLDKPKTAYVDLGKVYNEFTLKKQLEGQLKQSQLLRQGQLDSLKLDLNVLVKNIQSGVQKDAKPLENEYQAKRQQYALKNQTFSEENERLTQVYDEQIWAQLNQYMKDFGKENEYQYIFGADGSGAIMYADDADNITEDMVAYVNDKYKGKPTR